MTKMEWYGDDVIRSARASIPVAVRKACVIVEGAAKTNASGFVVTGALMNSITHEMVSDHEGKVGPAVVYDRRIELGFVGTDSLGRRYNQAAQPYLRPAADSNRARVARELGVVIGQGVEAGGKR